jgi:hypothetical protein
MKRFFVLLTLSVLGTALLATDANAQAFTFGSFNYNKSSGGALGFTNNNVATPGGSVAVTASGAADGGAPVTFRFEDSPFLANAALANGQINARLSWNGTTTTTDATNLGSFIDQSFGGANSFVGIYATEAKSFGSVNIVVGQLLLGLTFTGGNLTGISDTSQPAAFAAGDANALSFSSTMDLFDFSQIGGLRNFGTTYTSLSTGSLKVNTGTNQLIKSFLAGGAQGSFGAAVVPEPASIAMVGLGLIGVPALAVIRRRRAAR